MPSALIGALRINFSADTAEFRRNMTQAEKIADKFGYAIGSSIRRNVLAFGAAVAAAAGPAALGLMVKSSMEAVSAQVDLANRVGASVAAIQTLQETAKLAGASQEALAKTLGVLNARLGEAAREGAGKAYEALQRLGLSAKELSEMDADERVKTLADRMQELGFTSQQYADTLRSLGVRQQEIINLFIEGSSAIDKTREDLQAWGVLLSDIDAAQIEAAGDAWDKLGIILTGIGNQLALRLSPFIIEIVDNISEAAKETGGFGSVIDQAISGAIHLFGGLQREIYDIRVSTDEAIASFLNFIDSIAGAPPNLLANIFGGTAEDYGFKPINENFGKLRQTLELPPSEAQWNVWLANIRKKSADAAAVAANASRGISSDDGEDEATQKLNERQAKELAQYQEHLASKLTVLQESLMTEREAEMAAYEQRLLDLEDFHARGMLSDQEYRDALIANSAKHATALKEIDDDIARNNERNAKKQRDEYFDIADNITSALSSLFGESKGWAIAEAIINTATAITKALAVYGPTPQGFAAAAAAAAAGAAQLATIRKQSHKSGGGSSPSVTRGSSTSSGDSAQPQSGSNAGSGQTLFVKGLTNDSLLSGEMVRELAQKLIDYQRDGGRVVLT